MLNPVVSRWQIMGLRDVQTQMDADPFTLVTPKSISGFFEDSVVAVAIWITVGKSARGGCRCRAAHRAWPGWVGMSCIVPRGPVQRVISRFAGLGELPGPGWQSLKRRFVQRSWL